FLGQIRNHLGAIPSARFALENRRPGGPDPARHRPRRHRLHRDGRTRRETDPGQDRADGEGTNTLLARRDLTCRVTPAAMGQGEAKSTILPLAGPGLDPGTRKGSATAAEVCPAAAATPPTPSALAAASRIAESSPTMTRGEGG